MTSRGSIRLRFLRSMLLMIVPVVIFCLLFGLLNTQNLSLYVEQQALNTSEQTAAQISMFFLRLRSTATADLAALLHDERSPQDESAFASMLARSESAAGGMATAYLYLRGDQYIHTSAGRLHYTEFTAPYEGRYSFDNAAFFTSLNKSMSDRILSIGAREGGDAPGLTAYISPIYVDGRPVADVFFLIPYETFDAILVDCLGNQSCNFHILNAQLEVILTRSLDAALAYPTALLRHQQGIGVIRLEDEGQSLVAVRNLDSDNGLTYLCVYRHDVFYAALLKSQANIWLLTAVLMVVVVLLSLLIVHWNYAPIRKTFASLFDTMPGDRETNELDYLQLRWEQTRQTQEDLSRQLDEQRRLTREQLASRLMYGKIASEEEYAYLVQCAGLRYAADCYFAMYAMLPGQEADSLPPFAPAGAEVIAAAPLHAPGICYLFNFSPTPGQAPEAALVAWAQALETWMEGRQLYGVQIGVGSVCRDALRLNLSFHEAAVALRAGHTPQRRRFTLYEPSLANSLNASSIASAPEKYLLLEGIGNADAAVAHAALDAIAERLGGEMDSYLQFQFSAYDLCHAVMELAGRFGITQYNERMMKLPMSESFAALREAMSPLVTELCRAVRDKRQVADIQLRTSLLHYVKTQYTDADFSLDRVMRALDISRGKVSTIFMEDLGTSFSQYVSGLRMAECQRQLVETDKQIKDIVHDIGYLDVSNFLRKFKALTGVTASQYRAMHQHKGEEKA